MNAPNSLLLKQLVLQFLADWSWISEPEGFHESCQELARAIGQVTELTELEKAGIELAEYASYSEIVGGLHVNRQAIRKWCDVIYDQKREIDSAKRDALLSGKEQETDDIDDIHFTSKLPSAGDAW